MPATVKIDMNKHGVARVILNRPQVHNAFNAAMISELSDSFAMLARHGDVRIIVISGEGRSFSAGADLNWMQQAALQDEAANRADAHVMARMFETMNTAAKPVIGLVQGAAFGGGVGLAACCDMVIAQPTAMFGLTEVRLGLIPAVISPFVIAKIGASVARRYMLTGERFTAAEALRIGLILADLTANRIAARRASDEGREGVTAFLEKRTPNWAAPDGKL
jgi:methylglutaconyl-CoA hydratase